MNDSICTGSPVAPEHYSCTVLLIPPPQLSIQQTSIDSPCFGQTGLVFELIFTGSSPFTLWYTVQRDQRPAETHQKVWKHFHNRLEIQPEYPGVYTVAFTRFKDSKTPSYQPIQPPSVTIARIHAPSHANIIGHSSHVCVGDSGWVMLESRGGQGINHGRCW